MYGGCHFKDVSALSDNLQKMVEADFEQQPGQTLGEMYSDELFLHNGSFLVA